MAAAEVTSAVSDISGVLVSVVAVGLAVCAVAAVLKSFKFFRPLFYVSQEEADSYKPVMRAGRLGRTPFGYGDSSPSGSSPSRTDDGPDMLGLALGGALAASAVSAPARAEEAVSAPAVVSPDPIVSGGGGDFGGGGASGDF